MKLDGGQELDVGKELGGSRVGARRIEGRSWRIAGRS